MSKAPVDSGSPFDVKAWIVPGAVCCVLVASVFSYTRSAEIHAAAGSPYYSKAVREALSGLRNTGEKQALPAQELPAGLSADEHYWCEQCKTYHKRQPGGQAPAVNPPAGNGQLPPLIARPEALPPAAGSAGAVPPLPEGLSPADYYWCVNCKVYHSRSNPQEAVPGGTPPSQPPSSR
jgi:hypothetical protein